MMAITHLEVRRHPRWREELRTPLQSPRVHRLSAGAILCLATGAALVILAGAYLFLAGLSN